MKSKGTPEQTLDLYLAMAYTLSRLDDCGYEDMADTMRDMMDPVWYSLGENVILFKESIKQLPEGNFLLELCLQKESE